MIIQHKKKTSFNLFKTLTTPNSFIFLIYKQNHEMKTKQNKNKNIARAIASFIILVMFYMLVSKEYTLINFFKKTYYVWVWTSKLIKLIF